jgi:hypothetical protein
MTISSFEEAERHLDRAWYAAVVGATFDLVIGAMAILGTRTFTVAAAVYAARVLLMFGLAYGVSRRSRVSAVLLLLAGVLRMGFDLNLGGFVRILVGGVLVYLFARGVQGAFAYHRLRAEGSALLATGRKASA